MSTNVKAFELRSKSKEELSKQLVELKNELSALRVQKVSSGSASKVSQIRHVRKAIARVLTVMSHNERSVLRTSYAGKKYIPKDLRAKKTRAMRRRLTKSESSRKTARQYKKAIKNKSRKFVIKA